MAPISAIERGLYHIDVLETCAPDLPAGTKCITVSHALTGG